MPVIIYTKAALPVIDFESVYSIRQKINADFESIYNLAVRVKSDFESLYGIRASVDHESAFSIMVGTDFESLSSIKVGTDFETIYKIIQSVYIDFETKYTIAPVILDFEMPFSLRPRIKSAFESSYYIYSQKINSDFQIGYAIRASIDFSSLSAIRVETDFEQINNLIIFVKKDFESISDILSYNPVHRDHRIVFNMLPSGETIIDTVVATINGNEINLGAFDIATDDETYCLTLTATIVDLDSWLLCEPDNTLIITINAIDFYFLIDSRNRTRSFEDNTYTITGRSPTSVLDETRAIGITKTWPLVSARSVVNEICTDHGVTYQYDMPDWFISAGVLTADNESPINILGKLTKACGSIMQTTPSGMLVFRPKYPDPPPLYDISTPSLFLSDSDDIFTVNESKETRPKYNAVRVMSEPETDKRQWNIEIIENEDSSYSKGLAIYCYPFIDEITFQSQFKHSFIDPITVAYDSIVTEDLIEEIEIVEGSGSVNKPVFSVISYSFADMRAVDLGTIEHIGNSISTEAKGNSMLRIEYQTQYHHVIVSLDNPDDVKVQTYIES